MKIELKEQPIQVVIINLCDGNLIINHTHGIHIYWMILKCYLNMLYLKEKQLIKQFISFQDNLNEIKLIKILINSQIKTTKKN